MQLFHSKNQYVVILTVFYWSTGLKTVFFPTTETIFEQFRRPGSKNWLILDLTIEELAVKDSQINSKNSDSVDSLKAGNSRKFGPDVLKTKWY